MLICRDTWFRQDGREFIVISPGGVRFRINKFLKKISKYASFVYDSKLDTGTSINSACWHFYKLQMTIYYSSSDIAGVFYGKLIEIIINKDEKGVSIFLILHTPCGYFLRFVKKVSERLSHLALLESISTCLVQNIVEFWNSTP